MELQRLSIRSTLGRLGMESPRGDHKIESPPGELEISSPRVDMQIRQPRGELTVDSSAAWLALAKGGPIETTRILTAQYNERTMQAIAKIVQEGNRMKQISNPSSAVADIAAQVMTDNPENLRVAGRASNMNVQIQYTPRPAEIDITPKHPEINYHVSKPGINYTPQKVNIYMDQMNAIKMWVSNYDLYA
ncbi:DUF6470 family protein [Cohnella abietis]|uniref:Uncharacterized protein n=1 Tax=Cohnella abietis TaxID=2507935 RepID=A0A3T1DDU7_9BACL|nr:DUF6470 family protein [Cohnella abietis]BBI36148.1 hypothetical protein KCTCHS21_55470 [Cohnella abietis]